MRTLFLIFVAGLAVAQASSFFKPVGHVSQLMIDIIYPTSDAIFYVERTPPANDHDWNVLRGTAPTLAESGNLLMIGLQAIVALNEPLMNFVHQCHDQYRPGYERH